MIQTLVGLCEADLTLVAPIAIPIYNSFMQKNIFPMSHERTIAVKKKKKERKKERKEKKRKGQKKKKNRTKQEKPN